MTLATDQDVVVVGCGIGGLAAANRAAELGLDVTVLEKSPKDKRGGHTRYSESFRVASTECDLQQFGYEFAIDDYSPDDFYRDIMGQTNGRADDTLARAIVEEIGPTVEWLTELGVEWDMEPLNVGYTAARTFFDGPQLVDALVGAAEDAGATFRYRTEAREILFEAGTVSGIRARADEGLVELRADAVIVAAGGYEYIQYPPAVEPFDDDRFRKAINYLVPRQNIVDNILNGWGEPAWTSVPELARGSGTADYEALESDIKPTNEFKVDEARSLLEEVIEDKGYSSNV